MGKNEFLKKAFSMPFTSPAYPKGPYFFSNREFFVITYETDMEALRRVVPEPLQVTEPIVKFEFMKMPDSTGFGTFSEAGQIIPVTFEGQPGIYSHAMYLDVLAPVAGGREIWGFPKKFGFPSLEVYKSSLVGKLNFGTVEIAAGTMGFKHETIDPQLCLKNLQGPNFLLKIIPHVDGSLRVCELVRYYLTDIKVKGAWTGPCSLELHHHALAPVADLPVRKVISGIHILADLVLPYGEVVYDYLQN